MDSLTRHCPAKVNLYLKVVGRRPDGYHDLVTVMQPLSLADELTLTLRGSEITLTCSQPELPVDAANLAVRAALAFQAAVGQTFGLHLSLTKNIPVAAGLGGGSSDAAAVLRGLNELRGKPLADQDLYRLARSLGADVPFFLLRGPALGLGIGDRLTPLALPTQWLVLVNPGFQVSTAWVYANLKPPFEPAPEGLLARFSQDPPAAWLHNDLETVTMGGHPELAEVKRALRQAGATGTLMSGSGPTVFGLFPDNQAAQQAAAQLRAATGYWTAAVQGLA